MAAIGQAGPDDADCERQLPAQLDQAIGRVGLGVDPLRTGDPAQQLAGLRGRQYAQLDHVCSGQPGQPQARRDQNRAGGCARQQRPYLLFVAGVVQHHQDAPAGDQRPEPLDPPVQRRRKGVDRVAEGGQEPAEHGLGRGGRAGHPVELDEELAVRVGRRQLMSNTDGQCGLSDAAFTGDHRGPQAGLTGSGTQDRDQFRNLGAPTDKIRRRRRQVRRSRPAPRCRRRIVGHRWHHSWQGDRSRHAIPGQDRLVQRPQGWARLDTQLLDQHLAALAEDGNRLGLAVAAEERQHQLAAKWLSGRVPTDQARELRHQLIVAAAPQIHVNPVLQDGQVQLVEPGRLAGEQVAGDAGQGRTTPQRQRRAQHLGGLVQPAPSDRGPTRTASCSNRYRSIWSGSACRA